MRSASLAATALVLSCWCRPTFADAGASSWVAGEGAEVRLVSAVRAAGTSRQFLAGIHFRLKPRWKLYWRAPLAGGTPPYTFDWRRSANVAATSVLWPVPSRISLEPGVPPDKAKYAIVGYLDEVVLPVRVTRRDAGGDTVLALDLEYAACEQVCVFDRATLSLSIPTGPGERSAAAPTIEKHAARVPVPADRAGVRLLAAAGPDDGAVTLALTAAEPFVRPDAFAAVEGWGMLDTLGIAVAADGKSARFSVAPPTDAAGIPPLGTRTMTVIVADGPRAVEWSGVRAR